MVYGIIFWGKSIDSNKVFLQQKRIVKIILGINPRSTFKPHIITLVIMAIPSLYILSLMELLVNNLAYFFFQ